MRHIFCSIIVFLLMFTSIYSWDGFDYNSGSYIEIDGGNLVREGEYSTKKSANKIAMRIKARTGLSPIIVEL